MAWIRVSPGIYKDSVTGKTVRSQTTPGSGGANPAKPGSKPGAKNYKLNTGSQAIDTTFRVAGDALTQGNLGTNPNQTNDFGSSTLTIDPATGQPTVNQSLSEGNRNVVGGIQGASTGASGALSGLMGDSLFGGSGDATQGMSKAIFERLTRGLGDQKAREFQDAEQNLANRGIPIGSSAYSNTMGDFNKRYDNLYADAQNRAVEAGVNASIQSINPLSQVANSGFFNPNLQPFQSVTYQQPDVGQIFNTVQGVKTADKNRAAELQAQQMRMRGAGGSGGGGGASPFSNSPPPGYTG